MPNQSFLSAVWQYRCVSWWLAPWFFTKNSSRILSLSWDSSPLYAAPCFWFRKFSDLQFHKENKGISKGFQSAGPLLTTISSTLTSTCSHHPISLAQWRSLSQPRDRAQVCVGGAHSLCLLTDRTPVIVPMLRVSSVFLFYLLGYLHLFIGFCWSRSQKQFPSVLLLPPAYFSKHLLQFSDAVVYKCLSLFSTHRGFSTEDLYSVWESFLTTITLGYKMSLDFMTHFTWIHSRNWP